MSRMPESRKGRRPRRQFDEESPHAVRDRQLRVLIRASHERNRRAYGSPRVLKDLLEAGSVTPVIDKTFTLSQVPEAMRYLESGRARGKLVVTVGASRPGDG